MNQSISRASSQLGKLILRAYYEEWLPTKKSIDRILEDMVLESHCLQKDRVQGIIFTAPQDRLLLAKEKNREYTELSAKIDAMEEIIANLDENQLFIVEAYHRDSTPWWECARILQASQTGFYRLVKSLEEKIAYQFMQIVSVDPCSARL